MNNLIFEMIDRVGIVKINRPESLNALNKSIIKDLDKLIERIKSDPDIKVLIIGSDDNFAAGADIKEMVNLNAKEAESFSFSKTFRKIEMLEIPTIAAIEGYALGGGVELALSCDFRVVASTAKMGFPEINLGIMPGAGGTVRVAKLIGISKAKELIFFGGTIDGDRAVQIGLANKVVEHKKAMETAVEWGKKLCTKAPLAMKMAKKTIDDASLEADVDDALKIEGINWANLFSTEDQKEGMKAFLEKKKPSYKGK